MSSGAEVNSKSSSLSAFTDELMSEHRGVREGYAERSAITQSARLVKALRHKARLSQFELAEPLRTTEAEIFRLEAGTGSRGPTIQMLARVSAACDAELVLGFKPRPSRAD